MATTSYQTLAQLVTSERLHQYLAAANGDHQVATALYDWNVAASGALLEDFARLEVVLRNAFDRSLHRLCSQRGWTQPWYLQRHWFPGETNDAIGRARQHVRNGGRSETHGRVIAALTFGFWRSLCAKRYLTTLWVPALASSLSGHPERGNVRTIRAGADQRMRSLNDLRNRIAHHEPVFGRDLTADREHMRELMSWVSPAALAWFDSATRTEAMLDQLPASVAEPA
ncbi:hypothetical protein [Candidatus Poriferisodalis sp.]|uniref:hypothetical protein n=1 Tax=Candidatus Poriferisodalis sp. TaxID=3101277 RepID=UPI003B029577